MEKKKKIILGIGIGIFLILLGLGSTYAYWVMTHKQTEDNVVSTGCFKIEYAEGNGVTLLNGFPVTDEEGLTYQAYTFQISNLCNDYAAYQVNMETMPQGNDIKVLPDKYVKVGINENKGPSVITKLDKEENPDIEVEPNIDGAVAAYKVLTGKLMKNETKSFEVRIWMSSDTPAVEESMNASYLGKVSVVTSYLENPFENSGTLMVRNDSYGFWQNQYRENTTKIVIEPNMNPHETSEDLIFDVSATQDKSVMSYLVPNEEDTSTYTLYIQSNGGVKANPDSSRLFYAFSNVTEIQGVEYFDTSNVTNMSSMFGECSSLTSLDLSSFDTSNVTNMESMFRYCSSLTSLDLSGFDTSNVTNMEYMFTGCSSLTSLDVSSFDTSNVTNMKYMFTGCGSLTSLDVSSFDTSNVTNMASMFRYCSSLTSLNLSSFDTSNVTNMESMFYGCSSLTSLNVSSFDTSNVTNMASMFRNMTDLSSLNISNFDTSNVTNMESMFTGCSGLTSLDVSSFDTSNVTDMRRMFLGCTNLVEIVYSDKFVYTDGANIDHTFDGCPANKPTYESWNGKF